jgi:catechol 2,3-dioxygenase-like lactoylglutathione lyase family enzyme
MNAKRIGMITMCGLLTIGGPAAAAGSEPHHLGMGRGVDHVASLVRLENFDAAADVWRHLGFSVTGALLSPAGATNRLIWFKDLSYLEVDAFTERNDFTAPFLDFVNAHEGVDFFGTEVRDAAKASTFLTNAGYPNTGPLPASPLTLVATGETVGAIPLWQDVILTSVVAPANAEFFLDYDEDQVQQMFVDFPSIAPQPHANTAQKIDTLFLVVSDLDAAIAFYDGLGIHVTDHHHRFHHLGATGALLDLHNAKLALLQPDGPGLVADFATARGEGILGLSVKVRNLHKAHQIATAYTGLALPVFHHHGRDGFFVPASVTHGVLLEMIE